MAKILERQLWILCVYLYFICLWMYVINIGDIFLSPEYCQINL